LFIDDGVHVDDLGVGWVDLAFQEPAPKVEERQVFRFQIIKGSGGG